MSSNKASHLPTIQGNTDTGLLKLLALVFMIIDHSGKMLFPFIPEMRLLGRIAFPLYAWSLVVGSEYTRDIWRYAIRIAVVGLIAQPFYMLGLNHTWVEPNIFLTLLLALLGIAAIKEHKYWSQILGPVLAVILGAALQPDYGWRGVFLMLMLYGARKSKSGLFVAFLSFTFFWGGNGSPVTQVFGWRLPIFDIRYLSDIATPFFRTQALAWMALPLIVFSTNTHFKLPKWLGYAAYPLHLAILAVIIHFDEITAWFTGLAK
jgi:hypothetical protein